MKRTAHTIKPLSVAILTTLSLIFSGSVFAVAGKFQFVNGEVQVIEAAGAKHTARKGDSINEGDTIAAAGDGFAQLKMEDGGFFAVRPDTEFKVDTFQFNGKEDGSEKGVFSLIKGSLRSVTGLIGKKHRDNYKIQTATSTIGIRGSGADVGHSNAIGTAVRTLFGGHSLTSGGKTIQTGPGQTALAPPGQEPKIVPNFPFNTSTSGGQGDKNGGNGDNNGGGEKGKSEKTDQEQAENKPDNNKSDNKPAVAEAPQVVIPIKTTDGTNLTENKTATGGTIGTTVTLPAGDYMHHFSALLNTGAGYLRVEQNNGSTYPSSNYMFDSSGVLKSVAGSMIMTDSAGMDPAEVASSFTIVSGTWFDAYHTPDNSIYLARGSNVTVDKTCSGWCVSGTDTFISVHGVIALATAPVLVQTLTGSANYTLAGNTSPTDSLGNVGTLNSAYLNANFTNQTASFGVNVSIAGKTLNASAINTPIVGDGFEAESSGGLPIGPTGLTVTCVGCGVAYDGNVGGAFTGSAAASAVMGYGFWPTMDVANWSDYIQGIAALTTGTAPAAIPSVAGMVGGGGGAVGSIAAMPGNFNDFNVVDNTKFSARHDLSGNLIAWNKKSSMNGDLSFSAVSGSVVQDGADVTNGVIWGRWGAYIAANHDNGMNSNLGAIGGLSFITGSHITTVAELGNYASFTGSGLSMGNTVGTYSLAPGSFPTGVSGAASGTITAASATVNFNSLQVTAFSVSGSGGQFGVWTAGGSGSIQDFMAKNGATGIALSGGCSGGSGLCGGGGTMIGGAAVGGLVGTQAQGLISTVGLTNGSDNLGGAVYMKR